MQPSRKQQLAAGLPPTFRTADPLWGIPGRCGDHGRLDVGDAADSDGLGETVDGDELGVVLGVVLGVAEVVGVGERLTRGV